MFVYVVTAALALSAGVMFGVKIGPPFRLAGVVAGTLIVGVVIGFGLSFAGDWPWIGPLFATISVVTSVLVVAEARRDEPMFLVEPYWRRVILVLSPRSVTRGSGPRLNGVLQRSVLLTSQSRAS